jgi:hypothetical protein
MVEVLFVRVRGIVCYGKEVVGSKEMIEGEDGTSIVVGHGAGEGAEKGRKAAAGDETRTIGRLRPGPSRLARLGRRRRHEGVASFMREE